MLYSDDGRWDDWYCDSVINYVCKRQVSNTPFGPVSTTTEPPETAACGHDWVEDLTTGICYRIEQEQITFDDARIECRSRSYTPGQSDPDLVSLSTKQEHTFVQSKIHS